jgi:cell division septation protein DedD
MVTFRLHRKGVILVAVGAVLVGILLFAAGYLTALRRSRGIDAAQTPPITASGKDEKDKKDAKKESQETPHISDEVFALRVGAFADEADAQAFVQELTARGHQPVVAPVTTQNGVVLQTVLIGRYSSRDEASSAAAELKEKQELSSAVVPANRTAS